MYLLSPGLTRAGDLTKSCSPSGYLALWKMSVGEKTLTPLGVSGFFFLLFSFVSWGLLGSKRINFWAEYVTGLRQICRCP